MSTMKIFCLPKMHSYTHNTTAHEREVHRTMLRSTNFDNSVT